MTIFVLVVGILGVVSSTALAVVVTLTWRAFRRGFAAGVEAADLHMWDTSIGGDQ